MELNNFGKLNAVWIVILSLMMVCWSGTGLGFALDSSCDIVFVKAPVPGGSPVAPGQGIYRLDRTGEGKNPVLLTSGFYSACDPEVSPDGKKILFAGKKSVKDHWHIWMMNRDGNNKKQITTGDWDAVSPLFAGTLFHLNDKAPVGQLVFVGDAGGEWRLYSCEPDGKNIRPISYTLNPAIAPDVLPNGRLIFSTLNDGTLDLLSVNIDGTDLMGYLTDEDAPGNKEMVRVSSDGRVYYIETGEKQWPGGGKLSYVVQHRRFRSYKVLNDGGGGMFHSPCPLPGGGLIASYRGDKKNSFFGLYNINKETGKKEDLIYKENGCHCIDARPLVKRLQPKGRSSFVAHKQKMGVLYCISVYISEVPAIKKLAQGTIKKIRVLSGNKIIGTAPVETDGSFHIKVPARTSLAIELLDSNGKTLGKRSGRAWVMPRESRGCIGCHEHRELAAPNRLPKAIVKPAVILGKTKNEK